MAPTPRRGSPGSSHAHHTSLRGPTTSSLSQRSRFEAQGVTSVGALRNKQLWPWRVWRFGQPAELRRSRSTAVLSGARTNSGSLAPTRRFTSPRHGRLCGQCSCRICGSVSVVDPLEAEVALGAWSWQRSHRTWRAVSTTVLRMLRIMADLSMRREEPWTHGSTGTFDLGASARRGCS